MEAGNSDRKLESQLATYIFPPLPDAKVVFHNGKNIREMLTNWKLPEGAAHVCCGWEREEGGNSILCVCASLTTRRHWRAVCLEDATAFS